MGEPVQFIFFFLLLLSSSYSLFNATNSTFPRASDFFYKECGSVLTKDPDFHSVYNHALEDAFSKLNNNGFINASSGSLQMYGNCSVITKKECANCIKDIAGKFNCGSAILAKFCIENCCLTYSYSKNSPSRSSKHSKPIYKRKPFRVTIEILAASLVCLGYLSIICWCIYLDIQAHPAFPPQAPPQIQMNGLRH